MLSLVDLADHPVIIFPAYIAALLPLTALYALDFITEKWKSVGDTRRTGQIYLFFSVPPLCFVVFYIHLQHITKDYKEMAAAMSAAIFCIFHILRTLWGLVQLDAFKQWNKRALRCLTNMGYLVPVYELVLKTRDGDSGDLNEKGREPETCSQITQAFSSRLKKLALSACNYLVSIFKYGEKYKESEKMNLSEEELGMTVDKHMLVNSSLVDNEFGSAELPCHLKKVCLLKAIWGLLTRGIVFRVSDHVECVMPVECSVRWLVVFVARFGSEWLTEKSDLGRLEKYDHLPFDEQKKVFRRRVFAVAVLRTTFDEGGDHISAFDPGSPLLKTPSIQEDLRLTVPERAGLPYMCSGYEGDDEICFEQFGSSVREVILGWDRRALSVLGSDERNLVEQMSSSQIACFAKMMSSNIPRSYRRPEIWPRFFMTEQVGDFDKFESLIPTELSLYRQTLWTGRFENKCVDQAYVHIDNWAALESGRRLNRITSSDVISETLRASGKGRFHGHKTIEMRAYEYDLSRDNTVGTRAAWDIVFVGTVMESVRAFLAHSVAGLSSAEMGNVNWRPRIVEKTFRFQCSRQLRNCLHGLQNGSGGTGTGGEQGPRAWNMETRLLWELQMNFHSAVSAQAEDNGGAAALVGLTQLMVLCMLGFPCLEVTKVRRTLGDESPTEWQEATRGSDTVLNMCVNGDNGGFETKRAFFRVKPVTGPQPMWLIVCVDYGTGTAEVEVMVGESGTTSDVFEWQAWKDSFMGRTQGQAEWRKKMVGPDQLPRREEALESIISTPMKNLSDDVKQWGGWPPLYPRMSMISRDGTFGGHPLDIENAMVLAEMERVRRAGPDNGIAPAGGETAVTLRAQAQTAKKEGRSSESLELLCECIREHKDPAALDEMRVLLVENGKHFVEKHIVLIAHRMESVLHSTIETRRKQKTGQEGGGSATIIFEKIALNCSSLCEMSPQHVLFRDYEVRCLFELRDPKLFPIVQECLAKRIFFDSRSLAAIFCFEQWKSSGESYERLLGEGYLEADALHQPAIISLGIGYLFEKGILRGRQTVHLKNICSMPIGPTFSVQETACHFMAHSPGSLHVVHTSTATAVRIYEHVPQTRRTPPYTLNRLGLVYLLNEGFQDLERSEAVLNRAKGENSKDAMCNLAVLHGFHHGKWDLAQQNLTSAIADINPLTGIVTTTASHRFKRPVPQNVSIKGNVYKIWPYSDICRDPHTSSMNNLAVMYEMEDSGFGDERQALELYERILAIDENPVALLNMIVLLKLGPAAVRDEARSQNLLQTLQSRLPDNEHMPVLAKSIGRLGTLSSSRAPRTWTVAVDELDDCAVFVKQFEEQS